MFVIPRTKQMASRMLDLPEPLRPVIELKLSSLFCVSPRPLSIHRMEAMFVYHPEITVRTAYDLKPWEMSAQENKRKWDRVAYVYNNFYDPHAALISRCRCCC